MARWIPVQGTNTLSPTVDQWWHSDAKFVRYMRTIGHDLVDPEDPFVWSGDIDGVITGLDHDWYAGGQALRYYLRTVPLKDRNIICHSHGLQVVLFACAIIPRMPINCLISVCSPIRADMRQMAASARPYIGHWQHIYESGFDLMQRLGSLFDKNVAINKDEPIADANYPIKGIGHSGVLYYEQYFPRWDEWAQRFNLSAHSADGGEVVRR
jgi:hypothetical protein